MKNSNSNHSTKIGAFIYPLLLGINYYSWMPYNEKQYLCAVIGVNSWRESCLIPILIPVQDASGTEKPCSMG
jgi:hypothetical protein